MWLTDNSLVEILRQSDVGNARGVVGEDVDLWVDHGVVDGLVVQNWKIEVET
jgi:hypothetical protein